MDRFDLSLLKLEVYLDGKDILRGLKVRFISQILDFNSRWMDHIFVNDGFSFIHRSELNCFVPGVT